MEPLKLDYSTFKAEAMRALDVYEPPPPGARLRIGDSMGSACFLSPPGHPSYFVQSIYTSTGNSPRYGAQAVIYWPEDKSYRVVDAYDLHQKRRQLLLDSIFSPLPPDHPRTRTWVGAVYAHLFTCYFAEGIQKDPTERASFASDFREFLWPVPRWELRHYVDDPRYSEEYRAKHKAEVEASNNRLIERRRPFALPENHRAVLTIRKYYPDYAPELDLIERPPRYRGDWYERLNRQPFPDECAATDALKVGGVVKHHNDLRCQFCGHNW